MNIPIYINGETNNFTYYEFKLIDNKIMLSHQSRDNVYEISQENLFDIMEENSVIANRIRQKLIAIELDDGSFYFANNKNEKYKDAFKSSSIKIKDLEVGEKVLLHDGTIGFFLGSFYYLSDWGEYLYSSRQSLIKKNNGSIISFTSKDIFTVDGYNPEFSDKEKNRVEHLRNDKHTFYCSTMAEVRAYAEKNNLGIC